MVYAVKIRDKCTGKFLTSKGEFTKIGRTFTNLTYAKTSVAGKLDLKNLRDNTSKVPNLEKDFKVYLGCEFVLYTDKGEVCESVQEYIIKYLQKKNNWEGLDYVNNLVEVKV